MLRGGLHEREPLVGLRARAPQRRHVVDRGGLEAAAIRVEDVLQPCLEGDEVRRRGHQYAASFRIASAIFAGLSMNQSSSAWL